MDTRHFALAAGIGYGAIGLLGFVPGIVQPPPAGAPELPAGAGYGYLLGLFPVNLVHNLVHLGVGLWGILAYRTWPAARTFARSIAVLFGALTVMGLVPGLRTLFGLAPLFGHDIWLHALTAVLAAYFARPEAPALAELRDRTRRAA